MPGAGGSFVEAARAAPSRLFLVCGLPGLDCFYLYYSWLVFLPSPLRWCDNAIVVKSSTAYSTWYVHCCTCSIAHAVLHMQYYITPCKTPADGFATLITGFLGYEEIANAERCSAPVQKSRPDVSTAAVLCAINSAINGAINSAINSGFP